MILNSSTLWSDDSIDTIVHGSLCNYSGLPLSTGAKKRAVTILAAPLQPNQRVRSESAAGMGTDSVKGNRTLARLAPKRSG
jgi:hypothetical protein